MYRCLTGDCPASTNLTEAEVDERVSYILDYEDPDLIWDLRVNSQGKPEKYDVFLEECMTFINSQVDTAVDDWRHDKVDKDGNPITHLAVAMNARHQYDQVKKQCPEGTTLPSLQWMRLQFWPRNSSLRSASAYTGKLLIHIMLLLYLGISVSSLFGTETSLHSHLLMINILSRLENQTIHLQLRKEENKCLWHSTRNLF